MDKALYLSPSFPWPPSAAICRLATCIYGNPSVFLLLCQMDGQWKNNDKQSLFLTIYWMFFLLATIGTPCFLVYQSPAFDRLLACTAQRGHLMNSSRGCRHQAGFQKTADCYGITMANLPLTLSLNNANIYIYDVIIYEILAVGWWFISQQSQSNTSKHHLSSNMALCFPEVMRVTHDKSW